MLLMFARSALNFTLQGLHVLQGSLTFSNDQIAFVQGVDTFNPNTNTRPAGSKQKMIIDTASTLKNQRFRQNRL